MPYMWLHDEIVIDICLSAGRNGDSPLAEFYIWTMLLGPHSGIVPHGKAVTFPVMDAVTVCIIRPHCLHTLHLATDVTCSMVCVSVCLCVCWAHGSAVQKWLNRSRCCLGQTGVGGSKEPYIRWGSRSPREEAFWSGTCQPVVTYMHMSALHIVCLPSLANVTVTCPVSMWRTNEFCRCEGNETVMWPFANYFGHLLLARLMASIFFARWRLSSSVVVVCRL